MGGPTESIISQAFYPFGFAVVGFLGPALGNHYLRRPLFATIQRHIAFGIGGIMLGLWFNGHLERKFAKRDAVIRHYIELHPEDFKEEKRQYKEVFAAWYPQR